MKTRGYMVHALSPLHAGVGQGIGLVDLPIAREATTHHPLVPGSSVKGVLRAEASRGGSDDLVSRLFGPTGDQAHEYAGAIRVSDARILLFPVRSDFGTFAWTTCPWVLQRLLRDLGPRVGFEADAVPKVQADQVVVGPKTALTAPSTAKVVLDGLPFDPVTSSPAVAEGLGRSLFPDDSWWRAALAERLAVVHDDLFAWLLEQATDVRAHVRIGEGGVVASGALWYEETLPPETVLAGLVQFAPNGKPVDEGEAWGLLERLTTAPIQLGGGATTGHGLARMQWVGSPA